MAAGWIYPMGFVGPEPAPPGYKLVVERDLFLGIVTRWRYVRDLFI